MKKYLLVLTVLVIAILMVTLVGCSLFGSSTEKEPEKYEVKVYDETGKNPTTYTATAGEYLEVPVETKSGYAFFGYYDSDELPATRYLDSTGKSLAPWKSDSPTKLYPIYGDLDSLKITTETQSVSFSSSTTKKVSLAVEDDILSQLDSSKTVHVMVELEHHEIETGVVGVGTFNWSNFEIKGKNSTKYDEGSFRSNSGFRKFARMYTMKVSELSDLTLKIERPSACVSNGKSTYQGIKATIFYGTEEWLNEHYYDNLKPKSDSNYAVYVAASNGSVVLNNSYSVTADVNIEFQDNLKDYIDKLTGDKITFKCSVTSYGDKVFLFSNWGELHIKMFDVDNVLLYESDAKIMGHNSGFETDDYSIELNSVNAKKVDKIVFQFVYPGANASQLFYYISNVELRI